MLYIYLSCNKVVYLIYINKKKSRKLAVKLAERYALSIGEKNFCDTEQHKNFL